MFYVEAHPNFAYPGHYSPAFACWNVLPRLIVWLDRLLQPPRSGGWRDQSGFLVFCG